MIWQNPWAWLGVATVAVPILIHLLGRGHARVQRFPTLRFVHVSRLLPTRRTRVNDWPLLLVRVAILATAAAALAQPLLLTAGRRRAAGRTLARVVIVDTSASMQRTSAAGERAIDVARRDAQTAAAEATTSVIVETTSPARALAGAAAWLEHRVGRRDVVVLSDFQTDALDSMSVAGVPAATGLRVTRVPIALADAPIEMITRQGDAEMIARTSLTPSGTSTEWSARTPTVIPSGARDLRSALDSVPHILAGLDEQPRAAAAMRAARTLGVRLPVDTIRDVAIVYPGYAQRADLIARSKPIAAPWMADVAARIASDPLLAGAAATSLMASAAGASDPPYGVVVSRSAAGVPIAFAVRDSISDHERLLVLAHADAGSRVSAALIAATTRALSLAPPPSELDPSMIPDAVLNAWNRAPSAETAASSSADASTGASDARWLWIVVLALLGIETLMRRERRAAATSEIANDRAA